MQLALYAIYLFLAVFNAGNMTTLQIQHYGIYKFIGKENFKNYMQANNKSALIPSIIPAMLLLMVNIVLLFTRPVFMPVSICLLSLVLNIIALASTLVWQRKLQGEMAVTGYDAGKIKLLVSTNLVRTIIFLIQAITAVSVIIGAVK